MVPGAVRIASAAALAVTACAAPARAQLFPSRTCQFAMAAVLALSVDLGKARVAQHACERERPGLCRAEASNAATIERQLRLAENYLRRYCSR